MRRHPTVMLVAIGMAALGVLATGRQARGDSPAYTSPREEPHDENARRHLNECRKRIDLDKYDEAVKECEAGALIEPAPIFFFNLGTAHRKAGRYERAAVFFKRYLTKIENMKGKDVDAIRKGVQQLVVDMDAAARREPSGVDPLPTSPPPASTLPVRSSAEPPAATTTTTAGATRSDTGARGGRRHPRLGWGLVVAGGALAVSGGGMYLWAVSKDHSADEETRASVRDRLYGEAENRAVAGHVFVGLGVGAVAVGAFVLAMPKRDGDARVTVAPIVNAHTAGASALVRF